MSIHLTVAPDMEPGQLFKTPSLGSPNIGFQAVPRQTSGAAR